MESNDRDRDYQNFGSQHRQDYNRYDRQDRDLGREFESGYRRHHDNDFRGDSEQSRYVSDRDSFRNYRDRDYDMERNYYQNTRGSQGDLGDIRQGYGISSFGGTSDRYDTVGNMRREREAQQQQEYGSGRMSGYSGSRFGGANYSAHGDFGGSERYGSMSGGGGDMDDYVSSSGYGGGYGNSSTHSDRGVPNYSMRSFDRDYGAGTSGGSTYGGRNYGGGTGYGGGNRGGSIGNNTYGSSSGNYGGYGSMGSGTHGSGGTGSTDRSNYGRYASDADRGGYTNRDPNF